MSRLSNCLLSFALNYGIFFGLTFVYVNINRRLIKCYKFIKIYIYFINLIYLVMLTISKKNNFMTLFDDNAVMSFAYVGLQIMPFILVIIILLFRIGEEKVLRKWHEICLPLQLTYFDKIPFKWDDKDVEMVVIFKILIIIVHSCCSLVTAIRLLILNDWGFMMDTFVTNYFILILCYSMLHHVLTLSYINYCIFKLNKQLEYDQVLVPFANIYLQLTLLLEEINTVNGPIIFFVLFGILLANTFYAYSAVEFIFDSINISEYYNVLDLITFGLLCIDMFLYFQFCDLVYRNARNTGQILMKFNVRKQNQEVEIVSLGHIFLEHSISICGLFDIDLSSLFVLFSEIVTLSIILIQMDYLILKYQYVP
ncbi:uncharacterized protein ACRADG_010958 [Cochliomyia hominivorax]